MHPITHMRLVAQLTQRPPARVAQVFLKPVMFALDNVLTGTAMAKVLSGVSITTGLSEFTLYLMSALCCPLGAPWVAAQWKEA